MTHEPQSTKRKRGRPPTNLSEFNIRNHVNEMRKILPEANLPTDMHICSRMGINIGNFSQIVNGHRSMSQGFLTGLHNAFVRNDCYRDEPEVRELSAGIWLKSVTDFVDEVEGARQHNPYKYLKREAVPRSWIDFSMLHLQGGFRDVDEGMPPRVPVVHLGDEMCFQVSMPFDGHLTVLSYDPEPTSGQDSTQTYWLDRRFGLDGTALVAGDYVVPRNGCGLKALGQPSRSALIGLAARAPIVLPWARDWTGPLPKKELRHLLKSIVDRSKSDRSITIFDFEIRDRPLT